MSNQFEIAMGQIAILQAQAAARARAALQMQAYRARQAAQAAEVRVGQQRGRRGAEVVK